MSDKVVVIAAMVYLCFIAGLAATISVVLLAAVLVGFVVAAMPVMRQLR